MGSRSGPRTIRQSVAFRLFCDCASISDYCCTKADNEYEMHQKKLLHKACSQNVTFRQKVIFFYDQLVNSDRDLFSSQQKNEIR